MRIAQVSHSLECGGSMAMVVALSSKLAECGHEVQVLCTDRQTHSAHEHIWIDWLQKRGVATRFLGRMRGTVGFTAATKLWWALQRERYDIVHSHLPMPDAIVGIARRFTFPSIVHVLTVHNTQEPRPYGLYLPAKGANIVYCSDAVRRRNPIAGTSCTVIPNGIFQSSYNGANTSHAET